MNVRALCLAATTIGMVSLSVLSADNMKGAPSASTAAAPAAAASSAVVVLLPKDAQIPKDAVGFCNDAACVSIGFFYDYAVAGSKISLVDLHGRKVLQLRFKTGAGIAYRCNKPVVPGTTYLIDTAQCTKVEEVVRPAAAPSAKGAPPRVGTQPNPLVETRTRKQRWNFETKVMDWCVQNAYDPKSWRCTCTVLSDVTSCRKYREYYDFVGDSPS